MAAPTSSGTLIGETVDRRDHVPRLDPAACGRRAGLDAGDDSAAVADLLDGRKGHAEQGVLGHLAGAQLVDHRLRRIDGDGEADVLGLPGDRGVDADDVALEVEQRAAGVARVDRGVGLQEVGEVLAVGLGEAAVLGRHDAGRHRRPAGEVEGVADGDDLVAHLEGIGVAQRKGRRSSRSTCRTARSDPGSAATTSAAT